MALVVVMSISDSGQQEQHRSRRGSPFSLGGGDRLFQIFFCKSAAAALPRFDAVRSGVSERPQPVSTYQPELLPQSSCAAAGQEVRRNRCSDRVWPPRRSGAVVIEARDAPEKVKAIRRPSGQKTLPPWFRSVVRPWESRQMFGSVRRPHSAESAFRQTRQKRTMRCPILSMINSCEVKVGGQGLIYSKPKLENSTFGSKRQADRRILLTPLFSMGWKALFVLISRGFGDRLSLKEERHAHPMDVIRDRLMRYASLCAFPKALGRHRAALFVIDLSFRCGALCGRDPLRAHLPPLRIAQETRARLLATRKRRWYETGKACCSNHCAGDCFRIADTSTVKPSPGRNPRQNQDQDGV